ncbi:MAG: hypothetical protein WKF35_01710 [Ferruginibacter sp.]
MAIALFLLTISTPFVMALQEELAKNERITSKQSPITGTEDTNPINNNTEEKVPNNTTSFSEEFLHDLHTINPFISEAFVFHKLENAGTYIAYHGELDVPPPDFI